MTGPSSDSSSSPRIENVPVAPAPLAKEEKKVGSLPLLGSERTVSERTKATQGQQRVIEHLSEEAMREAASSVEKKDVEQQIVVTHKYKYYKPKKDNEKSGHELLTNATVLKSDYPLVRRVISMWNTIVNARFWNSRPVLSFFSIFSKNHQQYKDELSAIAVLSDEEKESIRENTVFYGGETEKEYEELMAKYEIWKNSHTNKNSSSTRVIWHEKSDSLEAARNFKLEHNNANIAITSFANAVRVGGADSTGGKGSQEEHLFRTTYLRVSLEAAEKRADPAVRSKTGRYLQYYATIVSKNIPTISNKSEQFGYLSVSAPDLRQGIRSEGNYFKSQNNSDLIKEVLYRKLSVVMMAAAIEGFDVLELGAFGCGAFGNKPEIVAEVINDLIGEPRFQGVFTNIILPIGTTDPNRKSFEKFFPLNVQA